MMYFLTFYLVHNQVKHAFSTISPAPPKVTNWTLSYTLSLVFVVGFGEGMDGDSQGSELLGAVCCGADSIWEMLLKKMSLSSSTESKAFLIQAQLPIKP